MADTRTYIRLHDGMPDHPKIDGLSDRAFRLLIETWCWCSRHLTDGKVPAATWVKRGTPATRQELVESGLAEQAPTGDVMMHDYLQHQRSADEVAQMREAKREAGRKGGLAKAEGVAAARAGAKHPAKQTPSRTVASTETDTEVPTDVGTRIDLDRICKHLADRIEANGSRRPTIGKTWRDSARLLLDVDNRVEQEVHATIDWCQDSDFWRSNVLSMSKLREKYDTLRLQSERDQREAASVHKLTGGDGANDWMRRRL